MARIRPEAAGGRAVCAFLDMLAWSEIGPALLAASDDGYNVLVGSTAEKPVLFASYADHPQQFRTVTIGGLTVTSSAAGRYQMLARTWDALVADLHLPDFGPTSQDIGAIELIRECRALPSIKTGRIEQAIHQCRAIWASLPDAGYNQPEHNIRELLNAYATALATYPPDFGNVMAGSASTAAAR